MKVTKLIKITGRVQNVGFRYSTIQKARELNIRGFVQNLPDKSVYVEAQGDEIALEHFLLWCKTGPDWARVDKITVNEANATEFSSFVRK